jgi:hypothetical protein
MKVQMITPKYGNHCKESYRYGEAAGILCVKRSHYNEANLISNKMNFNKKGDVP